MNEIIEKITAEIAVFTANLNGEQNGNKSAGRRARVSSSKLTTLLKEYRKLSVENSK